MVYLMDFILLALDIIECVFIKVLIEEATDKSEASVTAQKVRRPLERGEKKEARFICTVDGYAIRV